MKSKKIIEQNLNSAFDEIAPDILDNILKTERIKEQSLDNDLRDEPLFLDEVNHRGRIWIPAGVVTCVLAIMLVINMMFLQDAVPTERQVACAITIDVNPSLDIQMDKDGVVIKVVANNKDGEDISKSINAKIEENNYSTEEVVQEIVKELKESGYLKKKTAAMLVSAEKSNDKSTKNLKSVRVALNKYKEQNEEKFVTVYQEYKADEEIDKIADKNGVSQAKAAYCLKVAEKTDIKIEKLCKESIAKITKQVMKEKVDLGEEIVIVESIEIIEEEIESITYESISEFESVTEMQTEVESESEENESSTEEISENATEIMTEEVTTSNIVETTTPTEQ